MSSIQENVIAISLAFTRYLYQMIEVKQSLFISLLEHNPEEALYWTYELYYSGFEKEVYDYILLVYNTIYKNFHPTLQTTIVEKYQKWTEKGTCQETDTDIGSIVYTLALRSYYMDDFMRTYLNVNIKPQEQSNEPSSQFIVKLTPDYIKPYQTYTVSTVHAYRILEQTVKYPVKKEYNRLFSTFTHENFPEAYRKKWLYFASFSPIWYERIIGCNGRIDYDTEQVIFDCDEDEDTFRSVWDYEPDEVPISVYLKSVGSGTEHMLSVKEFCEKYNLTIHSRIIKKPHKK